MTPRSAIFALPLQARPGEFLEALRQNHFSRVPVFKRDLDEIVGVFHVKDLLRTRGQGKKMEEGGLRSLLRKAYFIPASKKLDDLLKEFQKRRIHLAIVVDEYGKTAGLVTLEDLLEELFGEIMDDLDIKRRAGRRKERARILTSPPGNSGSSRSGEAVRDLLAILAVTILIFCFWRFLSGRRWPWSRRTGKNWPALPIPARVPPG
jgi:Mg2+/Co2+ transporter CorB